MEIRPVPAGLAQIARSKDGRMVQIEDDVANVVRDLHEIDPAIHVRWSEAGEYFVLYGVNEKGDEYLILTANELDQRIVNRIREIGSPDYDYGAELDKQDREAQKEQDHRFSEQVGEIGERLAHALRKDKGVKLRAVIPKDLNDDAA